MCGFGIATIFQVAIFVIVVLVVLALLRAVFPSLLNFSAAPYGGIIQIVLGGVVAILILMFIWRMAECAGLMGRYGLELHELPSFAARLATG